MLTTYIVMRVLGDDLNGGPRTRIASKEYLDPVRAVGALRECRQESPGEEYALFSRTVTNWKPVHTATGETESDQ